MMTQELDLEDPLAIVQRLNADDGVALIAALTDDEAQDLVDCLKAGADKYWAINPNRSLEMADTIIKIAEGRDNLSHKALGMMARGDALKLLGHSQEAWDALGDAGEIFLELGDEVGWARTRIGRIALSARVNHVSSAFLEGKKARTIFIKFNATDYLMRLDINTAYTSYILGDHQDALQRYNIAISLAKAMKHDGEQFMSLLYINLGSVYGDLLGNYKAAYEYYQLANDFAVEHKEIKNIALTKHNLAYLDLIQGHYLRSLTLFYEVLDLCISEKLPFDANHINKLIVECYLSLNRFSEARDLAYQVIINFHTGGSANDEARTYLHLAVAEAELSNLKESQHALNEAERIFTELGSKTSLAITRLYRGRLALRQGDIALASVTTQLAVDYFRFSDQRVNYGTAMLLEAQVQFASGDLKLAKVACIKSLTIAHHTNMPLLRYGAHLLLGHIAEAQGDFVRAVRRYHAAIATIEHVQQGLTITLRSGFLEDKNEALESLISLYIQTGNNVNAFEVLERAKSQVFLNYITNRQLLHWSQDNPKCQPLIRELDQLRSEHHWWYQKANIDVKDEQISDHMISVEDMLKEVATRERRMRVITEQLYLHSSATAAILPSSAPSLQDIQNSLDGQTLLIEFYDDGKSIWIFTVDATNCEIQQSSVSYLAMEHDLNFLHFNIDTTINADTIQIPALTKQARFLLRRLFDQLLSPIASRLQDYRHLIFIPYGSLHYVPFHLLLTGDDYLIEHYEIIVLPAAGYVTRIGPSRAGGARVIAHSLHGSLPHAIEEAEFVHDLFGGTVCIEDNAFRAALQETPTQILHIATHAEYRQQQPDLSYIELADGHLFTDDLFQQDMSYELVTLSACETGRSHVASSDELIGLGRGFLYAGAGALVASLWRIVDDVTPRLMELFYRELYTGASKAAALRTAQLAILSENPQMHPAFWGAFQLVGDPRPLSSNPGAKNTQ